VSAYLALATQSPPQVGDIVSLEILLDESVGETSDAWKIKGTEKTSWLPCGSFTLSVDSLHAVKADGNHSKLVLEAMVNQPGALKSADFTLVHGPSGKEFPVPAATLQQETQQAAQSQSPPPWTLPAMPFGGWNTLLIALLAALALASLASFAKRLLNRVRRKRSLNHKQRALQELQSLQKFARAKDRLKQEEWKKFSFSLAGIIRKFSDENFRIDSSDMTDREFLAELRLHAKARESVDALASLLGAIDEVRYGKKDLDATVVPGLLLDTRKFIEQTFIGEEEK
jgi:hypothetical protein